MRKLLLVPLLAAFVLTACHKASPDPQFKVYKVRGKVVSTDATKGEVMLDHEAIPGFMQAMTMPYKLKNPAALSTLHPGDVMTADVLVAKDPDVDMLLDQVVVVAQARPGVPAERPRPSGATP